MPIRLFTHPVAPSSSTSGPILYEFLWVTTHPRVMRHPWKAESAWSFIAALLASPGLGICVETERHADVERELLAELPELAGNPVHDAHTAILMREHGGARIRTRDTDFAHFPFLQMIDPVRV